MEREYWTGQNIDELKENEELTKKDKKRKFKNI